MVKANTIVVTRNYTIKVGWKILDHGLEQREIVAGGQILLSFKSLIAS